MRTLLRKDRSLKYLLCAVGWLVISALMCWLALRPLCEPLAWLSWKDNVYPRCDTFEIREEGEYDWFGTIKVEYDIEVQPGQYVCVMIDGSNRNYGWYVMAYYGQDYDPEKPRHELRSWMSTGMLNFGMPELNLLRTGEWMCYRIPKMMRYSNEVPAPYTLFKAHWCGFGKGGVVARPIIVVSDVDLGE